MERKHKDIIIAWANGAEIQLYAIDHWVDIEQPSFADTLQWRIKPEVNEEEVKLERIRALKNELRMLVGGL